MNIDVSGIHCEIDDEIRSYIDKRLHRIDYAQVNIIDLIIKIIKEKKGYKFEAAINFKWGNSAFMKQEAFDLHEGIDKLVDKIDLKVKKEKDKVKDH
ncbi:MAG: ribosome-associated translation inhibitor RaiA [Spirochaetales bacterium]|nr:ribosome-associated translation inhibitor RaiA [Spirochaetales bacterium]